MVDVRTLALANLVIQILLIIMASGAVYHAKKKNLGTHCTAVRVAVFVQIIATAGVMLPSMLGYLELEKLESSLYTEILAHHTLGLAVIGMWVYINLDFMDKIKRRIKLVTAMRLALFLWILAFLLGLHMYMLIYL